MIQDLIRAADAGQSVYITDLHALFGRLPDSESHDLAVVIEMLDGTGLRRFDLRIPRIRNLDHQERTFIQEYIHAEVYNIISALGGPSIPIRGARSSRPSLAGFPTSLE